MTTTTIPQVAQIAQVTLLNEAEDRMTHSPLPVEFIDGRHENVPAYLAMTIKELEATYEAIWGGITALADRAAWNEVGYRGSAIIGSVTIGLRLDHDDFPLVTLEDHDQTFTRRRRVEIVPTPESITRILRHTRALQDRKAA